MVGIGSQSRAAARTRPEAQPLDLRFLYRNQKAGGFGGLASQAGAWGRQAPNGFTLLELLVVVAIMGLLAVLAPPYVEAAVARFRAEQAADDVGAALAEGRTLATRGNYRVAVHFDSHQRTVWVENGSWRRLPNAVTLSAPPGNRVTFNPDGTSEGGQLVVAGDGVAWSLTVDPLTGRVRRVVAHAR